jgi:putative ABC transport system permease protein
MLFWVIVKAGLKSLLANKLRSILAMLGIIIGVGAVISMLSIAAAARKQVMSRISAMGVNLLIVRPGQSGFGGVMSGTVQNLTLFDAESVVNEVPGVAQVAPVVSGSAQVKYLNRNTRTYVIGSSLTYMPIRDFAVAQGRAMNEAEVEGMARVALLGSATATDLFDVNDPVGQTVKIKGINFRVIGVLKAKGDQGWFNMDDQVIVPYTTAMKQLFGQDYLREIDVQAKEGSDLKAVQDAVAALLRRRHRIQEGAPDDFNIRNQADILDTAAQVSQTFTVLLGSIASISLLVGGIGIMNIMLVTVTERTREIGVRMAIGAKRRSIRMQFLIEALIISGLGGLIGVGVGIGGAKAIAAFSQFQTTLEVFSILLALSFSGVVGVFFGWYPASRAAKLDPIEALRYE